MAKLVSLVKLLLVLSHGQASVERGFSVYKEIEIENFKEQSLVTQGLICDHVKAVDGLLNIDISKPLLVSAGMVRQRYNKGGQKGKKKTDQEQKRRKDVLEEMNSRRRRGGSTLKSSESANEWADKAESVGN